MTRAECAIRIRALLTESDESEGLTLPRIQAVIPAALESYARDAFRDRSKRELFKTRFDAEVESGELDLTDFLNGEEGRISLDDLRRTTVYAEDQGEPVSRIACTWVGSWDQLAVRRPGANRIPAVCIEGSTLRYRAPATTTAETDDDLLTENASVSFSVPSFPASVEDLPTTVEQDFIRYTASILGGANGGS